jgi:hypothetical protein
VHRIPCKTPRERTFVAGVFCLLPCSHGRAVESSSSSTNSSANDAETAGVTDAAEAVLSFSLATAFRVVSVLEKPNTNLLLGTAVASDGLAAFMLSLFPGLLCLGRISPSSSRTFGAGSKPSNLLFVSPAASVVRAVLREEEAFDVVSASSSSLSLVESPRVSAAWISGGRKEMSNRFTFRCADAGAGTGAGAFFITSTGFTTTSSSESDPYPANISDSRAAFCAFIRLFAGRAAGTEGTTSLSPKSVTPKPFRIRSNSFHRASTVR